MRDPGNDPFGTERSPLRELLRWVIALPIAMLLAGVVFVAMAHLADGSWIVKALIRVFPLEQKELTPEERCEAELTVAPATTIEGRIGYLDESRFVPLPDAEIRGEQGLTTGRDVDVGADGSFRIVAALPAVPTAKCAALRGGRAPASPQLVVRARGCAERRVPVTAAWVPRRILLSCEGRSS